MAKPALIRYGLRTVALAYLFFLLVLPLALILWRTLEHGIAPVWDVLTQPAAVHALQVSLEVAIAATVANTLFGVGLAVLLVRHTFPGKRIINALVDLPVAVSPVVVGLALVLVYGANSRIGGALESHGIQIIFALPGMVIATIFVSLPLVVRAVVPVLEEIGVEQEQAAWTLGANPRQAFLRITVPAIRWALAYGVVLSLARCLGEFGAVAVVSGSVIGHTQTLPLFVNDSFNNFNQPAAYDAGFLLAVIAVAVLLAIRVLRPKEHTS